MARGVDARLRALEASCRGDSIYRLVLSDGGEIRVGNPLAYVAEHGEVTRDGRRIVGLRVDGEESADEGTRFLYQLQRDVLFAGKDGETDSDAEEAEGRTRDER